jgi:predicted dehydrogenase
MRGKESAMTDKVAWGVLSTANIGTSKVIPGMQKGALSRIDAIASRDLARARRVAGELGIAKAYGSYEALLADPDIEAVYIPLPNHLHVPWSVRALEAGKHVLCEKPVALNAEQGRQLVAARERSGKLVAEAFMVRHHPQWQRARELARSGRIGEVRAIQTFFTYFLTDAGNVRNQADIGGGGLMDIGCYAIATARYIFGAEPLRVAGLVERDPTLRIDRLSSALMEFPGNRHLTFTCSTQAADCQRVVVVGSKGRIEVLVPFNQPPDRPSQIVIDDGRDLFGGGAVTEAFAPCDQYTLQGDRFSRAIRGEAAWEFPIEDAILNMRVIDATFRAAERGTWEKP